MFGLGMGELLVIALVAFIAIGPDKLPQAARSLAQMLGKMKQARDELTSNIMEINPLSPSILEERRPAKKVKIKKAEVDSPEITVSTKDQREK